MWIHFAALLLEATVVSPPCSVQPGEHQWRIETREGPIRAFSPSAGAPEGIAIYVHGYGTTVDRAWREHRLPEQFRASCLPWLFIAPEAPVNPHDHVRFARMEQVLEAVRREAGALPQWPIVAIGHSGAYRTLRSWLPTADLSTIVLLDAAYGDLDPFAAWMGRDRAHGMILLGRSTLASTRALSRVVGGDPECANDLFSALDRPNARAFCYFSRDSHMQIVERGAVIPAVLRMAGEISTSLPSDASSATTLPWPSSRRSSHPPFLPTGVAGS
jgi:hypothetical protein